MHNRYLQVSIAFVLGLSFAGCSTSSPNRDSQPMSTATVSTYFSNATVPSNATFRVSGVSLGKNIDSDLNMRELNTVIGQSIVSVMKEKGYIHSPGPATFLTVEYFVAMENEISDTELNRRFHISAGALGNGPSRKYPKGTLFLDISEADKRKLIWRGTAQAFADVDAPQSQRTDRSQSIIRQMLRTFR